MKTKKLITGIVAAATALSCFTVPVSYAEELTGTIIYVSPNGNDSNDGSEGSPLASMEGARNKIREIKKSGMPQNGITVTFREGSYKWTDTLEFNSEDSGTENGKIVYRSYPGEKAVMEAGIRIPGSAFAPVTNEDILMKWSNAKAKQNIRQLDLKSYMAKNGYNNVSDYYTQMYDTYHFGGTYQGQSEEVVKKEGNNTDIRRPIYSFDGEPALWLARYPNKEGGWYADTHPQTKFLKVGEVVKDGGKTEASTFKYSERRISKYAGYDDVYVFGHLKYLFYHDEAKVTINSKDQTITTVSPLPLGISSNRDYFIFNILDELDAPGEYYVDKNTGMMYVYPNGDINSKTLNVSLLDKNWMIQMNGTSNVTFSGLTFENSKGGGIKTAVGDNVRIEYCSFNNFGTKGIEIGDVTGVPYSYYGRLNWPEFDKDDNLDWYQEQDNYWKENYIKGKNNGIYGCIINNTGNSGVDISGGNPHTDERSGDYVENCIIENTGAYKRTYAASMVVRAHGINIKNNRLGHTPAAIINGTFTVADIENNELYDGMTESNDNGLIYCNYQYPNLDIKIKNNYFHDTPAEHEIKNASSAFSQRSGIAFDNNYGGGIVIDNNVFVNIPRGSFLKTDTVMNNNVFVDCFTPMQTGGITADMDVDIPENITVETTKDMHDYNQYFLSWPIFSKSELGQRTISDWTQKYPSVMDWVNIKKTKENGGKNFYEAKNNLVVNKNTPLHAAAVKVGTEDLYQGSMHHETANNVFTDDTSMFTDYANRNYQLTADASTKYGNTLNLSKVGPQINMVGSDKFASANIALAKPTSGTISTPSAKMPEKVKGAVILRTNSPNAYANGKLTKIDTSNSAVMPKIIDGRTLVPARFISESFGGEVGWDSATRSVTITINGKTASLAIDSKDLLIDGTKAAEMDVPAQIIEDRTMVPLRILCETVIGKKVFWDNKGLIVISDTDNILDSTADSAIVDEALNILK